MAGANIPDIASDPEKGILKVSLLREPWKLILMPVLSLQLKLIAVLSLFCLQLQEKFRLDLDDEEAVQFFQSLINDSVSALFPQMVETIHRWAQYWR